MGDGPVLAGTLIARFIGTHPLWIAAVFARIRVGTPTPTPTPTINNQALTTKH
jgi:hypothetical protein